MDESEIEAIVEKYLRENLTIEMDSDSGYYGDVSVSVKVLLKGKEIASDSYYVSGSNQCTCG
jgi:hypothetical protein